MHVLRMLQHGGWFGVFYAPDMGTGVGGQAQNPAPAGEMPAGDFDGVDDSQDAGAAGGDSDIDDDDLLDGDDQAAQESHVTAEEQIKRLRRANKKLRTRYGKAKAVADRFRDVDVDQVITNARQFEELRRNPRANARGDADDRAETRRQPTEPDVPALPSTLTAETLGFNPNESTANRVLAGAIAHINRLTKQVAQFQALMPTVENIRQTVVSDRTTRENTAWRNALGSLETELKKAGADDAMVTFARDAIIGAYHTRAQHGQSPDTIVKAYLAKLAKRGAITSRQAGQASAAVQSRMANHNQTLPRSPAGGGTPSSAHGNTKPTLKDVHARLKRGLIGPR